jgi:hypothetical protein
MRQESQAESMICASSGLLAIRASSTFKALSNIAILVKERFTSMGAAVRAKSPTLESTPQEATEGVFTLEEGQELFDRTSQLYLGISGGEFLVQWDRGAFADSEDQSRVMRVASLIPLVRKTSARQESR